MIHNALSRLTEVQRGAKVAFGLDSGAGGLERLSESIQVTHDLFDDPVAAYLLGRRLCMGVGDVAAGGAGNYSGVSFSMGTAGWIARLRYAHVNSPTAGVAVVKRGLQLPTNSAELGFRDMRITGSLPNGIVHYVNGVAAVPGGTAFYRVRLLAGETMYIPLDWVIVNGGPVATETACVIYHGTANVDLTVGFVWEERTLLPGELAR